MAFYVTIQIALPKYRFFFFCPNLNKSRLEAHGKKLPVFPNLGPGARGPVNASIGRDEVQRHLQRAGGDVLVARWQRLEQLIDRCREANRANGVAIERYRRRVEQALAVVRGQARAPGLYGANGVSQMSDVGHVLARA